MTDIIGSTKKLKAYFFHSVHDTAEGAIIIAHSAKEALAIGRKELDWAYDCWFVDHRATIQRDINVEGLKLGVVDPKTDTEWFDCVKRGILDYPADVELPCPQCKKRGILSAYVSDGNKETVMCEACAEKDE